MQKNKVKMMNYKGIFCALSALTVLSCCDEKSPDDSDDIGQKYGKDRNTVTVSPQLSASFGVLINIEGKLIMPPRFAWSGNHVIEVTKVENEELQPPIQIVINDTHFGNFFEEENVGDIGEVVQLVGYETGMFVGSPKLSDYHNSPRFHFQNEFMALSKKAQPNQSPANNLKK